MYASNDGFPRKSLSTHTSQKMKHLCCTEILRKKINWFAQIGVPLPRNIFKSRNGSVLQNEVKQIRKILLLSKTTMTLFPIKVTQYINTVS
jgi:hypothetical protein